MSSTPDPATPAAETTGKSPEFDGEFDAEKATRLVENLRGEVAALKASVASVTSDRDAFKEAAEKTGTDRDEALDKAVKRAEAAERTLAISKHNLPEDVLEEFADYLTGTPAEVDAKAAKLAARFKTAEAPAAPVVEGEPVVEEGEPAPVVPERPRPALTPGHGGEPTPAFDAVAIAKAARRV